jgi:DNA-binding MarR family transcriptional regulator/N-acetylglutamate synthase-like GNAT family acetyltransferase
MTDLVDDTVVQLRRFNRFYSRAAGLLEPRYQHSPFSLVEARIIYEIAQRGPVLAKEIGAELGLDAGYLSRTIARFEQAGWVSRERGDDARQRPVRLTEQGRAAFDAMDRDTRASMAKLIEPLTLDQRRQLSAAFGTVEQMLGSTGSGEVTLRTSRAGDMGQITARQSILYSEVYGWGVGMEALIGEITAGFLRNFQAGREQCWIAERDGRMLGCVFLVSDSAETARLRLLYVEAEARGLGIGNALVEQCVTFARDAGYRELVLWTHTVLDSARKIYAAHGFEITSVDVHDDFGKPEQGESWRLAL